ncbi:hypothetical protein BHS07_15980 [Myxococcus xanthus]|uniref:Uncharacterized protein n=1 Tax=Myxococcus xanthus TaxID=34 RepID=A0AAE6G078_MYXXA|nr:hypothetical protein BHS09_15805 [Myxococcus xanthus]QDE75602.1 hypothetical protein BHS08_15820 [Myxococcus xanthus]QDE82929.1 hypothetical protein BHS07_15980 [Myxococcus xanthus]
MTKAARRRGISTSFVGAAFSGANRTISGRPPEKGCSSLLEGVSKRVRGWFWRRQPKRGSMLSVPRRAKLTTSPWGRVKAQPSGVVSTSSLTNLSNEIGASPDRHRACSVTCTIVVSLRTWMPRGASLMLVP